MNYDIIYLMTKTMSLLLILLSIGGLFASDGQPINTFDQLDRFDLKTNQVMQKYIDRIDNSPFRVLAISSYLETTIQRMLEEKRVFKLNDHVLSYFGLEKMVCHGKKIGCKKRLGFYSPMHDLIFIDEDQEVDKVLFLSILFHESIHAFQYNVRFPLDYKKVKSHLEIDNGDGESLKFLNSYYERQAHYITISVFPDLHSDWLDLANTEIQYYPKPINGIIDFATLSLANTFSKKSILPGPNNFLAIDIRTKFEGPYNALKAQEPVHINRDKVFSFNKVYGNFDIGWHQKFGKSVSSTYYGNVDKYYSHILFNELDYNFYEKFFSESGVAKGQLVFPKNNNGLFNWLIETNDRNKVYDSFDKEIQTELERDINLLFESGDEGIDPDLFLTPALLQHNLLVLPL